MPEFNTWGPVMAFMSSVTWAIGTVRYSQMAEKHTAFAVNFGRALFALPLFAATALMTGADFTSLNGEQVTWLAISMIASYAIGDASFLAAARQIGVPAALAIASIFPIWSAAAGLLFLGEGLTLSQTAGLFLAVLGVCGVILAGRRQGLGEGPRESHARGYALAGMTSLFWAINSTALAYVGRGLNIALVSTVRMLIAIVLIAILARFFTRGRKLLMEGAVFRKYWWVFVLEAYGGSLFFIYGLSHTPVALGVTLASLAPVISVPLALISGLERPSPLKTVGVCATVAGIALLVGGRT
jgi:drug/metabolite transporter (DMT)-like permease